MRILGIDYGLKKIGLAISEGELAEPLKIVSSKKQVVDICQTERIEKIVVGISEGKMAKNQRRFGRELAKITSLPVEFQDETLTSKEAVVKMLQAGKKRKFRRQFQDAVAAAIILQNFLKEN